MMSELPRIAPTSLLSSTPESVSIRDNPVPPPRHQKTETDRLSPFARFKLTCSAYGNKLRALTAKSNHRSEASDAYPNQLRQTAPLRQRTAANDVNITEGSSISQNGETQNGAGGIAMRRSWPAMPTDGASIQAQMTHASDPLNHRQPPPFPDLVLLRADIHRMLNQLDAETHASPDPADANAHAASNVVKVDDEGIDSWDAHQQTGSEDHVNLSADLEERAKPMSLGDLEHRRAELEKFIYSRIGDTPDFSKQSMPITRSEIATVRHRTELHGPRPMPSNWPTMTELEIKLASGSPAGESREKSATVSTLSAFAQKSVDVFNLARRRRQTAPTVVIPSPAAPPTEGSDGLRSALKSTTSPVSKTVRFASSAHTSAESNENE